MKTNILILVLGLSAALYSCDNSSKEEISDVKTGTYILNNGNYASNDASLALYNPDSKAISTNVFENANGKKLGDLAQDMLIYGGKMYIAVYNSKVIFVTDRKGDKTKRYVTYDTKSFYSTGINKTQTGNTKTSETEGAYEQPCYKICRYCRKIQRFHHPGHSQSGNHSN